MTDQHNIAPPDPTEVPEADITDAELEALLASLGELGEDIPDLDTLEASTIERRVLGRLGRDTLTERSLSFAGAGFFKVVLNLFSPIFRRKEQQRNSLNERRKREGK